MPNAVNHVYIRDRLNGCYVDTGPASGSTAEKVGAFLSGGGVKLKPADWNPGFPVRVKVGEGDDAKYVNRRSLAPEQLAQLWQNNSGSGVAQSQSGFERTQAPNKYI